MESNLNPPQEQNDTPVQESNEMTLDKFNSNFAVKVVKYVESSDSIVVGYTITCLKNETSRYFEASVPASSQNPQEESWTSLKASIKTWATDVFALPFRPTYIPTKI